MTAITKKGLSEILGISTNAITAWESTQDFRKKCYDGNSINLEKVVRFLYDWKNEIESSKPDGDSSDQKKYWDAKNAELKYKQATEELVPKQEYLELENERLIIICEQLRKLPDTLAAELSLTPDRKEVVRNKCRSVLTFIQDKFKEKKKDWLQIINGALDASGK